MWWYSGSDCDYPEVFHVGLHQLRHETAHSYTQRTCMSWYVILVISNNHDILPMLWPPFPWLALRYSTINMVVWCSGSTLVLINEVNLRRDRLVLGWMTMFNSGCRTFISVCDQPLRSAQPCHPFVGRCSEYQSKGGNALWLASFGRYGSFVGGR